MKVEFTEITEPDFEIIKEIYDYYIENSTATYYTEKISIAELKEFIPCGHEKYKSYLILADGECCGFCYLSQYKKTAGLRPHSRSFCLLKTGLDRERDRENCPHPPGKSCTGKGHQRADRDHIGRQ